eukprot:8353209-Heterocapsa_arctica.AAC.1
MLNLRGRAAGRVAPQGFSRSRDFPIRGSALSRERPVKGAPSQGTASVVRPVEGAVPGREPPLEGSRPREGATLAEGYSRAEQSFQESIREPNKRHT